ncbi:uncharacterized protein BDV17DRAFT_267203 [Aspergillus undulatus]|uniref:uncharacterized protein n=1 Tax=Aspergillus undulatus TaxID=1810928 RepID=UPI003CCCF0B0
MFFLTALASEKLLGQLQLGYGLSFPGFDREFVHATGVVLVFFSIISPPVLFPWASMGVKELDGKGSPLDSLPGYLSS